MKSRTPITARLAASALVASLAIFAASNADAHHSFYAFDTGQKVTIAGTVAEFQWTNPHSYILLDVPQPDGSAKRYTIEIAAVSLLKRAGWKYGELKPGDKVSLTMSPLRDGRAGGLMDKITLPGGRVLGSGF